MLIPNPNPNSTLNTNRNSIYHEQLGNFYKQLQMQQKLFNHLTNNQNEVKKSENQSIQVLILQNEQVSSSPTKLSLAKSYHKNKNIKHSEVLSNTSSSSSSSYSSGNGSYLETMKSVNVKPQQDPLPFQKREAFALISEEDEIANSNDNELIILTYECDKCEKNSVLHMA